MTEDVEMMKIDSLFGNSEIDRKTHRDISIRTDFSAINSPMNMSSKTVSPLNTNDVTSKAISHLQKMVNKALKE